MLAGLQYLGRTTCLAIGVAIVAGHNLLDVFWPKSALFDLQWPLWVALHAQMSWQLQSSGAAATAIDFLTTKYPPSLLFLLMTLGPAAIVCARSRINGRAASRTRWSRSAGCRLRSMSRTSS